MTPQHPFVTRAFELYKTHPDDSDPADRSDFLEWVLCQIREDLGPNPQKATFERYVKDVIEKNRLGFNHQQFDTHLQKEKEQDDYVLNPFQAEEGVVECKKCGSSKVYSISVQTRAADEPMTTASVCTICKHNWSQNG
jgi:DNA-directed RNA polymerase subunit M/transcription elongation factor TFIIS